jgi:hypothetical protein
VVLVRTDVLGERIVSIIRVKINIELGRTLAVTKTEAYCKEDFFCFAVVEIMLQSGDWYY